MLLCLGRLTMDHVILSGLLLALVILFDHGPCIIFGTVACLSHLTMDHIFLSGRSTVPTLSRDTSNVVWGLNTVRVLNKYDKCFCLSYPLSVSPSVGATRGRMASARSGPLGDRFRV